MLSHNIFLQLSRRSHRQTPPRPWPPQSRGFGCTRRATKSECSHESRGKGGIKRWRERERDERERETEVSTNSEIEEDDTGPEGSSRERGGEEQKLEWNGAHYSLCSPLQLSAAAS